MKQLHRVRHTKMRMGVFGYDLKFIRPLLGELERNHRVEVRTIESGSLHAFPSDDVADLIAWSDVIVAEFFGPYVPTLASMVGRDQPLVVRLHRFELHRGFADAVEPDSVARVICVNDYYASELVRRSPLGDDRITVIPNAIDTVRFDRRKTERATNTLGFLGAASRRKRVDLALDILDVVRLSVPDATLSIKSERPENLKWVMDDPTERAYFESIRPRLEASIAEGAVQWNPHGRDVAEWFTDIGFVVSTSDDESFHMAPAEGMASGTIPVVRRWPGADTVYQERWLFDDVSAAAPEIIRHVTGEADLGEARAAARAQSKRFALPIVADQWFAELSRSCADHGSHT